MLAATHALGGAAAAVAVATATHLPPLPAALAGAFGALLPDLDSHGSKGSRLLGPALALGAGLCTAAGGWTQAELKLVLALLVAGALAPPLLARCLGHRGVMHSAALHLVVGIGAAVAATLCRLPPWLVTTALFATIGSVVGGLGLDACTIRGVPLLWPFHKEKVHLVPETWRVRTGKRRERYVRALLGLTLLGLLVNPIWSAVAPPLLRLRQPVRQLRSRPRAGTPLVLGSVAEAAPRPCRRHPGPGATGLAARRGAAC